MSRYKLKPDSISEVTENQALNKKQEWAYIDKFTYKDFKRAILKRLIYADIIVLYYR